MKPAKPSRPKLRWDQYKRQVLCCLYRFFICDKKETEEIFSYMFRGHLNRRGILGFIPFATLNTQWVSMKNKRDPIWSHVDVNTAFKTDGESNEIVMKIKSAAKTLRFQLREKMEDDINTLHRSSLGPDGGRGIGSDVFTSPIIPRTLATPETRSPMVLVLPSQEQVSNERLRASRSIDQIIYQQNDVHSNMSNPLPGSSEPVVSSHGKLCLWCECEGVTYESVNSEELQSEDNDHTHDSENEDNSRVNQHNNRRDGPAMREYTQGFKQLMRELDGEVSSDEGALVSESREYVATPQESPQRLRPSQNPHFPMHSDIEQESLRTGDSLDWCIDRRGLAGLAESGALSVSMEHRSGALGNDQISTHNTLSNRCFSQSDTSHKKVSRYGWPSNDEMSVDNLCQTSVEVLSQIESQPTTHFSRQADVDIFMYDGNTWSKV